MSITSTPALTFSIEKQKVDTPKLVADLIVMTSFYAATGALAGHLFSLITPIGGAAFGVTTGISSYAVAKAFDKIFGDSVNEKIVKFMGKFVFPILVGIGLLLALGISLTLAQGTFLILSMIPTAIFITLTELNYFQKIAK